MPSPLPIERKLSLQHHLQFNHFPSVHWTFVPVAEAAIDLAVDAVGGAAPLDQLDDVLTLPNGVRLTVQEIMDGLHLWDYVSPEAM